MTDLFLIVPFLALVLLNLLPRRARGAAPAVCAVVLAAEAAAAALLALGRFEGLLLLALEKALGFNLALDALSLLLMVCAGITGLAVLPLVRPFLRTPEERFHFVNLILVALIGINGIAMVRDLFTLFVFVEVSAVAAFILIALRHGSEALEGAWKYLLLSAIAGVLMLSSIGFFLLAAGGTGFGAVKVSLASPGALAWAALALFMGGLFIKGGIVPFHGWLPDAYTAAPPPVSMFLAGIVTKASGIYALLRLAQSVIGAAGPAREIFLGAGALTAVAGAFLAIGQTDMKRMLAYSSVSQIGYIVLALGGSPGLGVIAAAFHFFNHTIAKTQLFANAAAVEKQLGTLDMNRMGGLGPRMPVTGGTSVVASLSIAGLPPLAGFWSKLLIVIALWNARRYAFAAIAILTSVVTLAYFLSLQRRVFFGRTSPEGAGAREAEVRLLAPALALAAVTVAVGLGFPFALGTFLGGAP